MLVAVRHGETDWNVERRFQGQLDIPLNAVGCRQAEALRLRLSGFGFDGAYSSPLRRAFETARVIAGDYPILADPRLTEIHHGSWQGKTRLEIEAQWPDDWERWRRGSRSFAPPGGESSMCVRARVEDFLRTLRGTNVLCVSHGVVIQILLSILSGSARLGQDGYVPTNGSIHTFRFRNGNRCDYRVEEIA
jgi:broad specificity phosphatase PhoE